MKYETSEFLYELVDDTDQHVVIRVTDIETSEIHTERIDQRTAAHYQQDEGEAFSPIGFADFCESILDA